MHTYKHTHAHIHTCTHLHIHTFTQITHKVHTKYTQSTHKVHTCTHMYTHVQTCTDMYRHVHTCTHMYTHVHTFTHIYTFTHSCIYIYTYTDTDTRLEATYSENRKVIALKTTVKAHSCLPCQRIQKWLATKAFCGCVCARTHQQPVPRDDREVNGLEGRRCRTCNSRGHQPPFKKDAWA